VRQIILCLAHFQQLKSYCRIQFPAGIYAYQNFYRRDAEVAEKTQRIKGKTKLCAISSSAFSLLRYAQIASLRSQR
jgi:hypothetical protein